MRKSYPALASIVLASFCSVPSVAQHVFTDADLAPYVQDFNTLTGNQAFSNNATLPGVYAQAEFATGPYTPGIFYANNGSTTTASYYHFGDATGDMASDRSFGGIAATTTGDGIGHVGIRLKNGSNSVIRSLDVVYAMEHWYNSGKVDKARVDVAYRKTPVGVESNSLLSTAGNWTIITDLGVDAPSTATVIASRDGNSTSNRRVRQTTLSGIDLAPGEEIMIRWSYVLNNTTNGNGLSIDDVVIAPFTNVFYSRATGNLDDVANWSSSSDGTGSLPGDFSFSLPNATYYVQGNTTTTGDNAASRIGSATDDAVWTVNGLNSRIVVGLPGATMASRLYIAGNDNIVGRVDLSSNAALAIEQPNYTFTLGQLDNASTVEYYTPTAQIRVAPVAYGNLQLSGGGNKFLSGNTLVNGNLLFAGASSSLSNLFLGDYSLTIQRGGTVQGTTASAFVVTNGKGALRQTVANTGVDVVYPVGTSAGSYTPAYLRQPNSTTARNQDVYAVRVIDGMYSRYDSAENGAGAAVSNQNVKKTWLISEEVKGNSDITMGLQWNEVDEVRGDATTAFDRSKAYVAHYLTNSAQPYFDKGAATAASRVSSDGAATTNTTAIFRANRSGITTFSPFSVSSRVAAPLPVQLVAFTANPMGSAVQCVWQTAAELNNARFVVERSATGQHFAAIGTVVGKGTTSTGQQYQFTDATPAAGLNYYRLRQIDVDGTEALSGVVVVSMGKAAVAQVTPNPGAQNFRVLLPTEASVLQAQVFNILGTQVAVVNPDGSFTLERQPAGIYIVRVSTTQGTQSIRVVKE
ncbi:T9SS C-terminal target domain-containing protein [Hymenobacter sediminis]|uniref:T9SS type A sorting domain-containing protein n=1 Tax=Hymenobacter sediminis TaxID=2218621 RepID=UPI000DA64182|nr:T9SS type A sorting domain-containing protein [Hymenobacter sediminis]RPD49576.1 T9SS C-terminal target domain-containing protein [Hymenobacter sediminis]